MNGNTVRLMYVTGGFGLWNPVLNAATMKSTIAATVTIAIVTAQTRSAILTRSGIGRCCSYCVTVTLMICVVQQHPVSPDPRPEKSSTFRCSAYSPGALKVTLVVAFPLKAAP